MAEILRSEVPLLRDLGLDADWKVITGDTAFFSVTKTMHNALQGHSRSLTDHEKEVYLTYSTRNAHLLEESYDLVVAHDPQPLDVSYFHGRGNARWVWRCHIDTSEPNEDLWGFLGPFLEDYDAAVFTEASFVPPGCPVVGAAQWSVLRGPLPRLHTWVLATGAGALLAWTLGMVPSTFLSVGAGGRARSAEPVETAVLGLALLMGLVLGPLLGLAQWLALRRFVRGAALWMPANALAWACGMVTIFVGMDLAFAEGFGPGTVPILISTLLLCGAAVGAVHGLTLVWLVRPVRRLGGRER